MLFLSMPSFLSLEFNVVRFKPSFSAAPPGSTDHSVGFAEYAENMPPLGCMKVWFLSSFQFDAAGARSVDPSVKMTDRSMKFLSSLAFPGHFQLERTAMVSRGMESTHLFICLAYILRK